MGITALALGAQAGGPIVNGMAGAAQAKGEKQRAEINANIGRTRANQADTDARLGLEDELEPCARRWRRTASAPASAR